MTTKRFLVLLIAIALASVAALTVRDSIATRAVAASTNPAGPDSATRSYTAWAQYMEMSRIDSETRSYTSWAKAVRCDREFGFAEGIDSATRSYIAWAKSLECGQ
jgi:hypothetical protein